MTLLLAGRDVLLEKPPGVTVAEVHTLERIAAASAAMHRVAEIRRTQITGRLGNHERRVGEDWVVGLNGREFPVRVRADKAGSTVTAMVSPGCIAPVSSAVAAPSSAQPPSHPVKAAAATSATRRRTTASMRRMLGACTRG